MYRFQTAHHTLQFREKARTSRGNYTTHDAWYIRLSKDDDPQRFGIGECAPLPQLSPDFHLHPIRQYQAQIEQVCREESCHDAYLRRFPALLFALETAMLHYHRNNIILFDSPFTRGETGIPINGLIWMNDAETMLRQIKEKLDSGSRCLKLKIGAVDFDDEISLIRFIRQQFSAEELTIRLDANGAFSPQEAPEKLQRLAAFDIHSIEQPIAPGQWEEMARLTAESPIAIALDEELIVPGCSLWYEELLDTVRPHYLVLKPSLHGGISGCTRWIEEAEKRGIGWWITSMLESNIGLNAIAQWCATLHNPLPQGLGTGMLYTNNLSMPLIIRGNRLWFDNEALPLSSPFNSLRFT